MSIGVGHSKDTDDGAKFKSATRRYYLWVLFFGTVFYWAMKVFE